MIRAVRHRLAIISVLVLGVAVSSRPQAQGRSFDLLTSTVADIQAAVASGALTYERLVQLYLNRIDAYDKKGPRLNAVLVGMFGAGAATLAALGLYAVLASLGSASRAARRPASSR